MSEFHAPLIVKEVYLDYNGSAPLDPRVAEAMLPILLHGCGNASANHRFGCRQSAAVDEAREEVATMVGSRPADVIFTAGATEANNLILRGLVDTQRPSRPRILISAVEHVSVYRPAKYLEDQGLVQLDIIPVTNGGFVNLNALDALLGDDVLLISVMAANSETGVLNPIPKIAERAHSVGAQFHCDATQIVGRLGFDIVQAGADFASLSSHKICGPSGVGALVGTKESLRCLRPMFHGGGHERGLRSGSLNVAAIVGFGAAARIAESERVSESARVSELRDRLVERIMSKLLDVSEIGDTTQRLPNTTNLRFAGADGEAVLVNMDPVAVSTGSACSAGSIEPSSVLLAMGISRDAAFESVRFSLGRFTTKEDIDLAVEKVINAVVYIRSLAAGEV